MTPPQAQTERVVFQEIDDHPAGGDSSSHSGANSAAHSNAEVKAPAAQVVQSTPKVHEPPVVIQKPTPAQVAAEKKQALAQDISASATITDSTGTAAATSVTPKAAADKAAAAAEKEKNSCRMCF